MIPERIYGALVPLVMRYIQYMMTATRMMSMKSTNVNGTNPIVYQKIYQVSVIGQRYEKVGPLQNRTACDSAKRRDFPTVSLRRPRYKKYRLPPCGEAGFFVFRGRGYFFSAFLSAAYSSLTFASTAGVMLSVVSASISAEALRISLYFLPLLISCTARCSRSWARLVNT